MSKTEWTVTEGDAGTRLDKWLADADRLRSRRRAFDALARGRVFVDDVEKTRADAGQPVAEGAVVRLWMDRPGSASRRGPRKIHGLDILFEDDAIIVLDKPAGLLAVPLPGQPDEPSLAARIEDHWQSHRRSKPLVVHRIDRDTSGVVVFAHTPSAWRDLKACFARREPLRRYLALVFGRPEPAQGSWRTWIRWDDDRLLQIPLAREVPGAKEAVTRYEVLESFDDVSFVAFELETGRQHQVRVQAMSEGHPILGERLYAGAHGSRVPRAFRRQALHAAVLGFPHPVSREEMRFEAPLPGDMRHVLQNLRASARS